MAGERRQHALAADPARVLELGRVAGDRRAPAPRRGSRSSGWRGRARAGWRDSRPAPTGTPASSQVSRRTAASIDSPGSMKPASSEYMPGGQAAERPSSTALPCRISMMTTGSVRGKCSAPQAGQARRQPASATSERAPQRAQKGCVACQPRMPLAAAAVPASATGELGHHRAEVAEGERWRAGRVALARLVDEGPRAGRGGGAVPVGDVAGEARRPVGDAEKDRRVAWRRRRPRRSWAARRGGAAAPGSISGLPCQSARQSARGSARERRVARAGAPRGRARPGEGYGLGVPHACLSLPARPCRNAAAAAIGGMA